MRYITRHIENELLAASKRFPAIILTGPRRSGKTTLLKRMFSEASYYLVEDPDIISRVRSDPRGFLEDVQTPVILDEIQNVPELLNYVRSRIDASPRRKGQWIITGSQEAPLMRGVTESMAGRAAVFQLLPISVRESTKVSLINGGFPEVLAAPKGARTWFRSYVQTYLERDVRAISSIRDLSTFRRFLALLASRCGQILNKSDLAAPLGVSVPTITEWLSILEITAHIMLVPPFYENFGKRLIKSPKIYFLDSGLVCHLLGIESLAALTRSTFMGPVFEGFVAAEILKAQINSGRSRGLYFFRDHQGLEVDFVIPTGPRRLLLIEAKAGRTVRPDMAGPPQRLAASIGDYDVSSFVVHRPSRSSTTITALKDRVRAVSVEGLLEAICPRQGS